jgi:hypothetical protein
MATFEQSFRAAEEVAMRFLQADFGFAVADRRVTDDGTNHTGGIVRYESTRNTATGAPAGWSVTLAFFPLVLQSTLDISNASGPSYSVDELHRLERGAEVPAREHNLYDAMRDADAQRAEFERLGTALRASGDRFFRGDVTLWADLEAQRRRAAQDVDDTARLFASERAFKAQDWAQVVRLLEPASNRLRAAGAARLAYAKKKLGSRPAQTGGGLWNWLRGRSRS